jgi:hypothetical protein
MILGPQGPISGNRKFSVTLWKVEPVGRALLEIILSKNHMWVINMLLTTEPKVLEGLKNV